MTRAPLAQTTETPEGTTVYEDITYEADGGVARITLNRPAKLNALRFATYEELNRALLRAGEDPTVGVVVVAGGGRAFCAGGDLDMANESLTTEHAGRFHYIHRMIQVSHTMQHLSVPVICQVHGACVGGGAEMAVFADLVYAAESAFFLFNGTSIGGCSWWGAPQLLPLQVGLRRAEQILLLSERVPGAEAERIGLVNKCVPDEQLRAEVDSLCQRILDLSEEGLRLTKSSLRSVKASLLATMVADAESNVSVLGRDDLHAAFDAVKDGATFSWRQLRRSPTKARPA